ncbi:MAG: hypothetical protein EPO46_07910 [Lysobacter sp.]|nr:MAG: hypothetical protein EPO46_07910 [Lysobacter sp.]
MIASHASFDARARALHAGALDRLSPPVQAQLVQRRRTALAGKPSGHRRAFWPWAGMATTAVALAFALQLRPLPVDAPAVTGSSPQFAVADTAIVDTGTLLSEDPEFYLWLAGNDGQPNLE